MTNNKGKRIEITAIDRSPEMAQYLRNKWKDSEKWVYLLNVYEIDINEFRFRENAYDLIVAGLVFQFIPEDQREFILGQISMSLKKNGAFIWYEKCSENNHVISDIMKQFLTGYKSSSGLSSEEIIKKDEVLRGVMKPLPFFDNLALLKSLPFSGVSVLDKDMNFTLFVAVK